MVPTATNDSLVLEPSAILQTTTAATGPPLSSFLPTVENTTPTQSLSEANTMAVSPRAHDAVMEAAEEAQVGGPAPPVTDRSSTSLEAPPPAAGHPTPGTTLYDLRMYRIPKLPKREGATAARAGLPLASATSSVQPADLSPMVEGGAAARKRATNTDGPDSRVLHARAAAHAILSGGVASRQSGGGSSSNGARGLLTTEAGETFYCGSRWQAKSEPDKAYASRLVANKLATPHTRAKAAQVRRRIINLPQISDAAEHECVFALADDNSSALVRALQKEAARRLRETEQQAGGAAHNSPVSALAGELTAPLLGGMSSLLWAILFGATECVRWMLEQGGADTGATAIPASQLTENCKTICSGRSIVRSRVLRDEMPALVAAVSLRNLACIDLLLQQQDVNLAQSDKHGNTAMHVAASKLYTAGRSALNRAASAKRTASSLQQSALWADDWLGALGAAATGDLWGKNRAGESPFDRSTRASEQLRHGDAERRLNLGLPDLKHGHDVTTWLDHWTEWAQGPLPATRALGPQAAVSGDHRPTTDDLTIAATGLLPDDLRLPLSADLAAKAPIQLRARQRALAMVDALERRHQACLMLMISRHVSPAARWTAMADLWQDLEGRGETFVIRAADAAGLNAQEIQAQNGLWQKPFPLHVPGGCTLPPPGSCGVDYRSSWPKPAAAHGKAARA